MAQHAYKRGADGAYQKVISVTDPSEDIPGQTKYDAFGRARVSSATTLFDTKLIGSDSAPLFWDQAIKSGSGISVSTPDVDKPYIDFSSTLNTACVYTRRTIRRFNYQPGKSQLILVTGVLRLSGGGSGVFARFGAFDDDNGLFFEYDAESNLCSFVIRSSVTGSPVDTKLIQGTHWYDNLDGEGPSGITVDWSSSQIFVIDFQWLGVGLIRFGLEIDGHFILCGTYSHANTEDTPWASTPNFPICYQFETGASSPASSMRAVCCAVISEGGQEARGISRGEATVNHVDADTADVWYALIGIKLKTTHLGYGISPVFVSVLSEANDNFEWALYLDPTVAGTFTYSDLANSACQTAKGATANTVTGGVILARGFGATSAAETVALNSPVSIGEKLNGTRTAFVLAVRPLSTMADIQGAINWQEIG